jgi:hypothetical protein
MMKAFIKKLFSNPAINNIITDVKPNNLRAIRKQLHTPDGLMLVMEMGRCST